MSSPTSSPKLGAVSSSNAAPNLEGGVDENSNPNLEGGAFAGASSNPNLEGGASAGVSSKPLENFQASNPTPDQRVSSGGQPAAVNNVAGASAPANPHITGGNAMSSFPFGNPFGGSAVPIGEVQHTRGGAAGGPPNQPAQGSPTNRPGGLRPPVILPLETPISEMSAKQLADFIGGKITNFNSEIWIKEDISGAAFLEAVEPPSLAEFLEHTAKIESKFARQRVGILLHAMIAKDSAIQSNIRIAWYQAKGISTSASPSLSANYSALEAATPSVLFATPVAPQSQASPLHGAAGAQSLQGQGQPSFLREIRSRSELSFDDSALYSSERVHMQSRASVSSAGTNQFGSANLSSAGGGQQPMMLNITLNQPSAKPPSYPILQNASVPEEVYNWVRLCRKESLNCQVVDRRPLNQLVSQEVKEECSRIIVAAKSKEPKMFDAEAPIPSCWPDVTDKLLLRVLFGLVGPRNAAEAKARLKKLIFHFNDSTTSQSAFTNKLRKHFNKFKSDLSDFSYNSSKWPAWEELSRPMIIEAFSDGFNNTDTIKNKEGTAQVPKCRNLAYIRELIREKKQQHPPLPLEDIMNAIIDHFEAIAVRSSRGICYEVMPWAAQQGKQNKRKFNQLTTSNEGADATGSNLPPGGSSAVNQVSAGRPPKVPMTARPPTNNPRCNNCGSRGHICSERTCFLWGAPGALGANGSWPDGTPSLKLEQAVWNAFAAGRKAIFYGYAENQGKRLSK